PFLVMSLVLLGSSTYATVRRDGWWVNKLVTVVASGIAFLAISQVDPLMLKRLICIMSFSAGGGIPVPPSAQMTWSGWANPYLPGWRGVLTDGVTDGGRVKLGLWYVGEDRNTPYDGSTETPNPHNERTRIHVPVLTADVRFSDRLGLQAAVTI